MLVIPIIGKIGLKNPPFVTILLILVNIMIFVIFQRQDNLKESIAYEYYRTSDLSGIELLYYQEYVENKKTVPIRSAPRAIDLEAVKAAEEFSLLIEMMKDDDFQLLIEKKQIIKPSDELYPRWNSLRTEFKQMLNQSVTRRFGFIPAFPEWWAFFTSMFLHGGMDHLLGNMVFLWLLGCFLEMGCGRVFYLVLYLVSGVAGAGAFMLAYPHCTGPLIGASGAIAGMMGAFAVLFGKKKVKIFFSLGFYFSYRQTTAILLLPLWLFNEFYQLFFSGVPQVAYVAHIGGILAGSLMSVINLKALHAFDEKAVAPEPEDEMSPLIEKALSHMGNLEMDKAQEILEAVLVKDPSNIPVMNHLFNILRNHPKDARLDRITRILLDRLVKKPATQKIALKIMEDYEKATGRLPRLSPDLYVRIGIVYAYDDQLEASDRIITAMMKQKPKLASIPPALLKLANAYKQSGRIKEFTSRLNLLMDQYPGSNESRVAHKILMERMPSD